MPVRRWLALLGAMGVVALAALGWWVFHSTAAQSPRSAISLPASDLGFVRAETPSTLPEFTFQDLEGLDHTLDDVRGKVVLLNIWATWCAPCREEMPALDRLQNKLGGADFLVLPISIDRDGTAAVEGFYAEYGIEHLGLYVADDDLAGKLNVMGIPTTILIDRNGREIGRKLGPAEWDSAEAIVEFQTHMEASQ